MIVGALGDIVFSASSRYVKTISNLSLSGSARYATHDRHAGCSIAEYTGSNLAQITMDVELLAALGANPAREIARVEGYTRSGASLPLVLGSCAYGRWRWTIQSYRVKAKYFDGHGDLLGATLSLTLQEYL